MDYLRELAWVFTKQFIKFGIDIFRHFLGGSMAGAHRVLASKL